MNRKGGRRVMYTANDVVSDFSVQSYLQARTSARAKETQLFLLLRILHVPALAIIYLLLLLLLLLLLPLRITCLYAVPDSLHSCSIIHAKMQMQMQYHSAIAPYAPYASAHDHYPVVKLAKPSRTFIFRPRPYVFNLQSQRRVSRVFVQPFTIAQPA